MTRIKITPENCLASLYPEIAAQWHPDKNGELTPETVRVETTLRPWWRCGKGHEWQAKTTARAAGLGCPVCQDWKKYIRGKTTCRPYARHSRHNGTRQRMAVWNRLMYGRSPTGKYGGNVTRDMNGRHPSRDGSYKTADARIAREGA